MRRKVRTRFRLPIVVVLVGVALASLRSVPVYAQTPFTVRATHWTTGGLNYPERAADNNDATWANGTGSVLCNGNRYTSSETTWFDFPDGYPASRLEIDWNMMGAGVMFWGTETGTVEVKVKYSLDGSDPQQLLDSHQIVNPPSTGSGYPTGSYWRTSMLALSPGQSTGQIRVKVVLTANIEGCWPIFIEPSNLAGGVHVGDVRIIADPHAQISGVGFKYDEAMAHWPDKTPIDPGNNGDAIWPDHPEYGAAYIYGTRPTLTGKVSFERPLPVDPVVSVRAKSGGTVIASVSGVPIPAAGGDIGGQNRAELQVTTDLENPAGVKKGRYTWDWEISFDGGTTWSPMGTSGPHDIYWVGYHLPRDPADQTGTTVVRSYAPFLDINGNPVDQYMYDEALKRATEAMDVATVDPAEITRKITEAIGLGTDIKYDPRHAVPGHPLNAYTDRRALCADNARLLRGLVASLGYGPVTTYFVWGGDGATHHVYKYKFNPSYYTTATLRAARDRHDYAGDHPHFVYHAIVEGPADFDYDPSYGDRYDPHYAPIDETLADPVAGPFLSGTAALQKIVLDTNLQSGTEERGTGAFEWCQHDVEPQFAEPVSQDVPSPMQVGESYTVTVTFKNTGWNTWTVGGGWYLRVISSAWVVDDVPLPYNVEPDHDVTFSFLVMAPETTGEFDFHFEMGQSGFGLFGASSDGVVIVEGHLSR